MKVIVHWWDTHPYYDNRKYVLYIPLVKKRRENVGLPAGQIELDIINKKIDHITLRTMIPIEPADLKDPSKLDGRYYIDTGNWLMMNYEDFKKTYPDYIEDKDLHWDTRSAYYIAMMTALEANKSYLAAHIASLNGDAITYETIYGHEDVLHANYAQGLAYTKNITTDDIASLSANLSVPHNFDGCFGYDMADYYDQVLSHKSYDYAKFTKMPENVWRLSDGELAKNPCNEVTNYYLLSLLEENESCKDL